VRVFVHQRREGRRRGETLEQTDAAAARGPQCAVEIVDPFDDDAPFDDGVREGPCLGARIARGFARRRQRVAIGLLDILSRDSAS
jgi:hypothetical protein